MIAAGMCAQWRDDSEFMLKTFSQYYPSGSNKGQTFHYGNGDNNSGSIRDDYDNPEDLWEDNPDWYEDEDERGMSGRMVRRLFYGSATSKRTVIRLGRRR